MCGGNILGSNTLLGHPFALGLIQAIRYGENIWELGAPDLCACVRGAGLRVTQWISGSFENLHHQFLVLHLSIKHLNWFDTNIGSEACSTLLGSRTFGQEGTGDRSS